MGFFPLLNMKRQIEVKAGKNPQWIESFPFLVLGRDLLPIILLIFWFLRYITMNGKKPYSESCSSVWKYSEWKNSSMVIPKPSHSLWMVATVGLWFRPDMTLFTVDCVTPLRVHSLLIVMFLSWQSCIILAVTASPTVMIDTSNRKFYIWGYPIFSQNLTPIRLRFLLLVKKEARPQGALLSDMSINATTGNPPPPLSRGRGVLEGNTTRGKRLGYE